MINRLIRLSLAITALVFTSWAAASDWEEVAYDKDEDIRVFTRFVEGSDMKAFKGITTIKSTVTAPVALLQDVKRAHEWVFNCKAMDLIEELAPNNATYYTVTSMPWPVKNRDNISESLVTQDADTGVVTVTIQARNDIFPSNDDHVRVRELDATWTLEPKADGLLKVTYEAHADPGGGLPSWLVNSFVVEAPLNTLRDFRDLVVDEKYQAASREYITH
jgi:hypothetical protein